MQEIRFAKVNNREIPVLISDEKEALLAAKAAGRAIVGLWRPGMEPGELAAAGYVVVELAAVSEEFLERVVRRHLGLPWRICETERLRIREICGADFDEIWENQVGRGLDSVEKLEAYTKYQYEFYGFGFWALVEKASGELIGVAGLTVPREEPRDGMEWYRKELPGYGGTDESVAGKAEMVELELGYHIFPPYRRKGYARESCLAILNYAEAELEAERICLRIAENNLPSKALARTLGFEPAERGRV